MHTCHLRTRKIEAGGLCIWRKPEYNARSCLKERRGEGRGGRASVPSHSSALLLRGTDVQKWTESHWVCNTTKTQYPDKGDTCSSCRLRLSLPWALLTCLLNTQFRLATVVSVPKKKSWVSGAKEGTSEDVPFQPTLTRWRGSCWYIEEPGIPGRGHS